MDEQTRAVLVLMADGWQLIDPANGPCYLQRGDETSPIDPAIALTIGHDIRQVPIVEVIQRGDPIVCIIRSAYMSAVDNWRGPIQVPRDLERVNAALSDLERAVAHAVQLPAEALKQERLF
jgi:hypothetical protein